MDSDIKLLLSSRNKAKEGSMLLYAICLICMPVSVTPILYPCLPLLYPVPLRVRDQVHKGLRLPFSVDDCASCLVDFLACLKAFSVISKSLKVHDEECDQALSIIHCVVTLKHASSFTFFRKLLNPLYFYLQNSNSTGRSTGGFSTPP